MTAEEIIKYVVSKQFNKTDEEIAEMLFDGEALKDDAGDVILALNEEKVKKLKADRDDNFNKGFQKAEKQFKTFAETKFKEITGFDKEAEDYESLVKSYVEESQKKTKKTDLTDDDIKKHPLFIQLEQSRVPKEELEKVNDEFSNFKKNVERNMVLNTIRGKAWDIVAAKNPILPQSQQIATTLRNKFLEEFSQFDYEQQDGKFIVLKDGKRVEDQHGNLKPFDSMVLDVAGNFFEFQAQTDKGNAGNSGGGQVNVNLMPKTQAELGKVFAEYSKETDEHRKIRVAAMKYYEANKAD